MTTGVGVRPAAARAAAAVADLRGRIAAQHAAGLPAPQTCGLASDLFDAVVVELWREILADLPPGEAGAGLGVTVVAHGGFGRREMAPWSDIDLMLLHDGRHPATVAALAQRVVQDLFDAGLQVGQSVRTVAEACSLAGHDATILSTLLDCRCLAGPPEPVTRLAARLRRSVRRSVRRHAARLLSARLEEATRFGGSVALLEPNVKRSPGGLRDVQLIRWLGIVLHGAESLDELVAAGRLDRRDADAVRDAAAFLAGVRLDLHLRAGRCADDLTRDEQVRIAAARGIESQDGLLGVERFMRDYIGHVRRVQRVRDALAAAAGPPRVGWGRDLLGHVVEGRFRVGPDRVAPLAAARDDVVADPGAILRLAELGLLHGLPVEAGVWEAARLANAGRRGEPGAEAKRIFLRLLAPPAAAGGVWRSALPGLLRRLHEAGLLERFLPGFAHARDLLQFNNYHKYTVDEHSIVAVERCLAWADHEGWLGRDWRALTRPRPLVLALLCHDLAKGLPGDHSEVGAVEARAACERLGLPADEVTIVEFLVRRHLLMAHLAFRRDVGDEGIVAGFAREVGSPEVLRMLALLTAADVAAVGPGTWTGWKEDLLGDLRGRTLVLLSGEVGPGDEDRGRAAVDGLLGGRAEDDPVRGLARILPAAAVRGVPPARVVEELGRLARLPADGAFALARWQAETGTVSITVGTHERVAAGIFHRVAGALATERLEVLAADIHTLVDGHVLDRFTVRDPDFAGEPPPERLADIADAIRGALRTAEPPRFRPQWNPFAPRPAAPVREPVRVLFDNESARDATIVEVFATDTPALLYRVARALHEADLPIRAARIGTYLDQVVDAFHVTDREGRKVTDPDRLASLRRVLEEATEPLTAPH